MSQEHQNLIVKLILTVLYQFTALLSVILRVNLRSPGHEIII